MEVSVIGVFFYYSQAVLSRTRRGFFPGITGKRMFADALGYIVNANALVYFADALGKQIHSLPLLFVASVAVYSAADAGKFAADAVFIAAVGGKRFLQHPTAKYVVFFNLF